MTSERPDPSRPEEPEPGLDIDAAFAEIVAHWEPSAPEADEADAARDAGEAAPSRGTAATEPENRQRESRDPEPEDPESEPEPGPEPRSRPDADAARLNSLFQPSWTDSLDDEATWADEGHFVPPPPPPLPRLDPRRKIAWGALIGTPALAMVLLVLGWSLPYWSLVGMVAAFVGGFCYLVATMPSSDRDGWSGGDGAVV